MLVSRAILASVAGALGPGRGRAQAQTPELRTWTSGDFKVKAKFVSLADGKVTLEQADGEIVEIELQQLSAADRKYAAEQQQKAASNPFKKKASSPFQKKARNAKGAGRAMSPGEDEGSGGLVKPDWSGVQELTTASSGTGWNVPVKSPAHSAAAPATAPGSDPPNDGILPKLPGCRAER